MLPPEIAARATRAIALVALLLAAGARAEEIDPEAAQAEARATVKSTLDAVVAVLQDKSLSVAEQEAQVEKIAYTRFDFQTIARLVLARNWKRLSAEQRSDFVDEFERHLSLTYGKTLQSYQDETILVDRSRFEKNKDVTVRTRILGAGAEPILVDYRMRQHKKKQEWNVIDVIIEGVSLISNFRTQTKEIISDVGPDGLIERLRKKNEERAAKG
jgi:phospholipid transport system substrate-binding protein